MKKIKTLFMMDTNHQMTDVPNEGTKGVFNGEWIPRVKLDGSACAIMGGKLYKRYDRKLNKKGIRRTPPPGWVQCDEFPDPITGHWPGWAPVTFEDTYLLDAWKDLTETCVIPIDGTYELIGPKVQGNPYSMVDLHALIPHSYSRIVPLTMPMTYNSLKADLGELNEEGIVFHGPDNQYFKLRRSDFGFSWSIK